MERRGAPRDLGKERFWRRLLRLWRRGGGTIRAFCAEHQVSEASFFAWRRIIADRDREHASQPDLRTNERHDAPHPVTAVQPAFVPLRVVPSPAGEPSRAFEVVLKDERVVRVPAGFDAVSLRMLLAVLEERPC